jgi:2-C-methyl-D-erythritol 4-phosphate cytidylyltransferase/2-C-methyl-D-erythritol 2,4-cyclodiphosphate synthase
MNKTIAIIVAGGTGQRISSNLPKQFLEIGGKAILQHSMQTFLSTSRVDKVLVVVNKALENNYLNIIPNLKHKEKLLAHTFGGKQFRWESVLEGLKALKEQNPKYVLIHDAARPFVSQQIIIDVIDKLKHFPAVVPIISLKDSIKKVEGNGVANVPRHNLFSAQTPQGFEYKALLEKFNSCKNFENITDEISLFEASKIGYVEGAEENYKITTEFDFKMAQNMKAKTLIGSGIDVHKFVDGEFIILGGVKIPYHKKLQGHSDADVLIHALVDAILGAIGEGDIGEHFPDNEKKWKDADSSIFLKYAMEKLKQHNATINNIDITVIAEKPKISPYKKAIKENLSKIMKLDENFINIKATTTEGLGFMGRKEGIMCQSTVLITRV